jgi:hypothetical protein
MGRSWDKRSCVITPAVPEAIEDICEIPVSNNNKLSIRKYNNNKNIFTDNI